MITTLSYPGAAAEVLILGPLGPDAVGHRGDTMRIETGQIVYGKPVMASVDISACTREQAGHGTISWLIAQQHGATLCATCWDTPPEDQKWMAALRGNITFHRMPIGAGRPACDRYKAERRGNEGWFIVGDHEIKTYRAKPCPDCWPEA